MMELAVCCVQSLSMLCAKRCAEHQSDANASGPGLCYWKRAHSKAVARASGNVLAYLTLAEAPAYLGQNPGESICPACPSPSRPCCLVFNP